MTTVLTLQTNLNAFQALDVDAKLTLSVPLPPMPSVTQTMTFVSLAMIVHSVPVLVLPTSVTLLEEEFALNVFSTPSAQLSELPNVILERTHVCLVTVMTSAQELDLQMSVKLEPVLHVLQTLIVPLLGLPNAMPTSALPAMTQPSALVSELLTFVTVAHVLSAQTTLSVLIQLRLNVIVLELRLVEFAMTQPSALESEIP